MQCTHHREGNKKENQTMKSFNGLYQAMIQPEEIVASIKEAAEHKTSRAEVSGVLRKVEKRATAISKQLESGTWTPPRHQRSTLQEGSHKKQRRIAKPMFDSEQIVHHMLMRQLRPILLPRMYEYSCGSVPGYGPLYAVRAMKRWRDSYGGKKFYVAELDVKKFYDNVDTEVLKTMLHRLIRDQRYLQILDRVIDSAAPGLPLGYYTSPWLGNWYLTALDCHIIHTLRPDHYLRYMDNLFLFSKNKRTLHRIVQNIECFLRERLHLELNGSRQVYRFEGVSRKTGKPCGRAINALGFVIHRDRITLRKSILKRARAKANRMYRLKRCRKIDAAAMISYMGWIDHTDTYNYYRRWIRPKVNIQYCKRRISRLSKQKTGGKQRDRLEHCTRQPDGTA